MTQLEEPSFMGSEMFKWDGSGYRFAQSCPPRLLELSALRSQNPWDVLAAALLRAQAGDFSAISRLIELIEAMIDPVLSRNCATVVGDAGSIASLNAMTKAVFNIDKINLSHGLRCSCYLSVVPTMLEIYFSMSARKGDAAIIPILISKLLEDPYGEIAYARLPEEDYRAMVNERYEALFTQFGTDQIPVMFGALYSVRRVAELLSDRLKASPIHTVIVRDLRHRFEAATGIECSCFFRNREIQPLAAQAIVEEFLESSDADKYEPGVRYFFGHRIPD